MMSRTGLRLALAWVLAGCLTPSCDQSGTKRPPSTWDLGSWNQPDEHSARDLQAELATRDSTASDIDAFETWIRPLTTPECVKATRTAPTSVVFSKPCSGESVCGCDGQDLGGVLAYHIAGAADTVDVAVMELQDFKVSRALADAARRGVRVRVVLDDRYGDPQEQPALVDLSSATIPWITDPDPQRLMHSKFLVVDSRWTVLSSGNFSTFDARSNANNLLVFESVEMAKAFGERFDSLFERGQFYTPDKPSAGSLSVDGEDIEILHGPSETFLQQWTGAIAAARTSIHFSIYAFTLQEVREAILGRCGEVEILGVYDAEQSNDSNSVELESWCPQATVRPARVPGDDFGFRKLHHKVLIIDAGRPDGFVITGSANWSFSAIARNTEELVVLRHPQLVREYEGEFQARFQEAHSP